MVRGRYRTLTPLETLALLLVAAALVTFRAARYPSSLRPDVAKPTDIVTFGITTDAAYAFMAPFTAKAWTMTGRRVEVFLIAADSSIWTSPNNPQSKSTFDALSAMPNVQVKLVQTGGKREWATNDPEDDEWYLASISQLVRLYAFCLFDDQPETMLITTDVDLFPGADPFLRLYEPFVETETYDVLIGNAHGVGQLLYEPWKWEYPMSNIVMKIKNWKRAFPNVDRRCLAEASAGSGSATTEIVYDVLVDDVKAHFSYHTLNAVGKPSPLWSVDQIYVTRQINKHLDSVYEAPKAVRNDRPDLRGAGCTAVGYQDSHFAVSSKSDLVDLGRCALKMLREIRDARSPETSVEDVERYYASFIPHS